MEVDCIALSQSMRDLIVIHEVLKEFINLTLNEYKPTTYHKYSKIILLLQSTMFEHNQVCLNLTTNS